MFGLQVPNLSSGRCSEAAKAGGKATKGELNEVGARRREGSKDSERGGKEVTARSAQPTPVPPGAREGRGKTHLSQAAFQ